MWHRKFWAGPAIRLLGTILLFIAGIASDRVFVQSEDAVPSSDPTIYLLALVAFLGASCGSAMFGWGGLIYSTRLRCRHVGERAI